MPDSLPDDHLRVLGRGGPRRRRRHRCVLRERRDRVRRGPGVARPRGDPGVATKVATAYEYTVEVRRAVERPEIDGRQRHDVYTHLEGTSPEAPWI